MDIFRSRFARSLASLSWSVPAYDSYGVREFSGSGPLQSFSCLVSLGYVASMLAWCILAYASDASLFWPSIFLSGLEVLVVLILATIVPLVKENNPWELYRWIRFHLAMHSLWALIASLLIAIKFM